MPQTKRAAGSAVGQIKNNIQLRTGFLNPISPLTMPIPNEIASEPRMTPISDGVMFIIYGQYHPEPNVKAHPTVPGVSVVCGNLD